MAPLKFWKNETVEYERTGSGLGSMLPVIKRKVKLGAPTPSPPQRRKQKRKKAKQPQEQTKPIKEKPIKLPKNFKEVTQPVAESHGRKSVVFFKSNSLKYQKLPTRRKREKGEPEAMAAPVFNQPAFITGTLKLKPGAFKDNESTGECVQVFCVLDSQVRGVEASVNGQSFLVSPGDHFFVPEKTVYRIHNHSKSHECLLHYCVLKKR